MSERNPADERPVVLPTDAERIAALEREVRDQRMLLNSVAAAVADYLLAAETAVVRAAREYEARQPIPAPPWLTDAREALPREWIVGGQGGKF